MNVSRRPRRPAFPVVLVGLMGSGKSTVGRLLADRWGLPFIDLDAVIEIRSGLSIPEIFTREGEAGFREREAEASRAIAPSSPVVVAVGGGWMARAELRDSWPHAVRVWLRVSQQEAAQRLASQGVPRPLLENELPEKVLQDLLDLRLPSYGLSEYTVDTSGRTPAEVADLVESVIGGSDAVGANGNTDLELSAES